MASDLLRVPYSVLLDRLTAAHLRLGFSPASAALSARLFAETTRDGVYSHGLNRFPRLASMVQNGVVDVQATPAPVTQAGALERWNGRRGPGNLNAWHCMERTIALAREHGIACLALANTNHWMRGGTYGWQAAEAGVIGICWTNTLPNLAAWGALKPTLGNNPLVLALPRSTGHIVLDMAMSQFSYGALESYRLRGELLPVPGGFDEQGELTRDPAAIEKTQRALPIGFWKGSGLSFMLDLLAAMLSGGKSSGDMDLDPLRETGQSQIFLAIAPAPLGSAETFQQVADHVIGFLKSSPPAIPGGTISYPGEQTVARRAENLALGVPVDAKIWESLLA